MPVKVKDSGKYDLFEDEHGHRFLVLDGKRWYAWIDAQRSPILVRTNSDHRKKRELQSGRFYFVDFDRDPKFRDMPHLFLQKGEQYQEFLLPNGLPTENDPQVRFVVTRHTLPKRDLESYLKHPAPPGPGDERARRRTASARRAPRA
jgi:hypothetical protein